MAIKDMDELIPDKKPTTAVDKLIKSAYKNNNDIKEKAAKIVTTYKIDKERVGK